jgi:hypothetical protein
MKLHIFNDEIKNLAKVFYVNEIEFENDINHRKHFLLRKKLKDFDRKTIFIPNNASFANV